MSYNYSVDWIFYGNTEAEFKELLGEDEFRRFIADMELYPQQGDVIRGAGGFRKARYPIRRLRMSKSKGARVIYLFYQTKTAFHVATIYTHREKDDLTQDEIKELQELSRRIKNG